MANTWLKNMNEIKPEKTLLTSDLLAGLTFALVNIPQAMAHALLATVNPVFGLYTLMLATPVGALFTSAIFMNVSTSSALAVTAGDTLITYPVSARGTALVTLVILIGIFQIVLGLLRLGWVTRFIPFSVMTGFMTGVAVMVVIGQLGDFTGYYSSYSGKISQLADLLLNPQSMKWATITIGLLTILLTYWLGSTRLSRFSLVIALLSASGMALLLNWGFNTNIKLVGDIADVPRALPRLVLPDLTFISKLTGSGDCNWDHRIGAGCRYQPDLPQPGWKIFGYLPGFFWSRGSQSGNRFFWRYSRRRVQLEHSSHGERRSPFSLGKHFWRDICRDRSFSVCQSG